MISLDVTPYGVASELTGFGYRLTNLEIGAIGGIQSEFSLKDQYWVVRFGYRIPIGFGRIGVSVVTQDILPQFLTNLVPIDVGAGLSLLLNPDQKLFTLSTGVNVILERDRVDWIYPRTNYLYLEFRYFRDRRRGNTALIKFGSDEELIILYTTITTLFTLPSSPLYFVISAESLPNNLSIHEITYVNYSSFNTFLPGNAEPLLMSAGDYVVHGLVKGHWRDNLRGFTKNYDLYLQQLQVRSEGFLKPLEIITDLVVDSNFFEPEPDDFVFDIVIDFPVIANPSEFIINDLVLDLIFEPIPPIELAFDFIGEQTIQEFPASFYEDLIIGDLTLESTLATEVIVLSVDIILEFNFVNFDVNFDPFFILDSIFQEETFSFRWDLIVEFILELPPQILPIPHVLNFIIEDDTNLISTIGLSEIPDLVIDSIVEEVFLTPEEIIQDTVIDLVVEEVKPEPINSDFTLEFTIQQILPINLEFNFVLDYISEEVEIIPITIDSVIDLTLDEVESIKLTTDLIIDFKLIEGQIEEVGFDLVIDYLLEKVNPLDIEFDLIIDEQVTEVPIEVIEFNLITHKEVIEIPIEEIPFDLVIIDNLTLLDLIPPIFVDTILVIDQVITEVEAIAITFDFVLNTILEIVPVDSINFDFVIDDIANFRQTLSNPLSNFDLVVDLSLELADQIEVFPELVVEHIIAVLPPIFTGPGVVNCEPLYFQVYDLYYDEYCYLSIETRVNQTVQLPSPKLDECDALMTRTYELSADIDCLLNTTVFVAGLDQ